MGIGDKWNYVKLVTCAIIYVVRKFQLSLSMEAIWLRLHVKMRLNIIV
jgi:hypothetical protein